MALGRFRNLHAGQPVAILANGASLNALDLDRLRCKTITMNRSHELHRPDYHVCLEKIHADRDPGNYLLMAGSGRLFVAGEWPLGHVLTILPEKITRFSRDLEQGVVTQVGTVGSVAYVALQLAAWLGFRPIYFLGLDLGGPHFHAGWPVSKTLHRQRELFLHTPKDIAREVYVVGSPSSSAPFCHLSYETALVGMEVVTR